MDNLFDFAVSGMKAEANKLCHRNGPETKREEQVRKAKDKAVRTGKRKENI